MQEALDELVQLLTEPKFKGKLAVVLAGYEADIDKLMSVNEDLRSRFSRAIRFLNLGVDDALMLVKKEIQKKLELGAPANQALPRLTEKLVNRLGFANGRDIITWANRVFRQWSQRNFSGSSSNDAEPVTVEDLEISLQGLLEDCQKSSVPQPTLPSLLTASR